MLTNTGTVLTVDSSDTSVPGPTASLFVYRLILGPSLAYHPIDGDSQAAQFLAERGAVET
jgi:hypothetical protein